MMFLIYGLLINQAAAIRCSPTQSCPWYTFADCCGGVCWAFSSITQCDSWQCSACKAGASAAIKSGGQATCDVVTAAACEAAGGGPEDPIADICAASVVAICTAVWNYGLNDPDAVCRSINMCSSMEETTVPALSVKAGDECMDCLKIFGNNGGCEARESSDYTQLKRAVPAQCVDAMKDSCRAQVPAYCDLKAEQKAKMDRLASAEALTETCNTVGDTWDYCRWGPLKDPSGVEIISGSTYTFKLHESSERFHWTCSGSDEYSRIDRANTIEAHYGTDGHIHWIGKACYGLKGEKQPEKLQDKLTWNAVTQSVEIEGAVAAQPLKETCNDVGDTWDYCRWGPLKDPSGVEIISGSTYTFKLNYSSERFHWTCSGSDEYSRIDRANTIEAHYGTDGHIHWQGKACYSEGEVEQLETASAKTDDNCWHDGVATSPFCIAADCCNQCCWGTSFPFLGKCCTQEEFDAQKTLFANA